MPIEDIEDLQDPTSDDAITEAAAGALVAGRVGLGSARAYARVGRPLTLTDSVTSDTTDFIALVSVLSFHEMAAHFTETETDAWARPMYRILVAGEFTAASVGDTVALTDGSYTVRKVDPTYISSVVYCTVLYVARDV